MNNRIERRDFIKRGIATDGAAAAAGANILGANDRVRVGVIGPGRQGRGVMKTFMRNADVQIVALCDVFHPQMDFAINDAKLEGVDTYRDFRRMLDRKDIDAVIVASPDHWHALQTVMACQASKDVYVEKPVSSAVDEGRKMAQAARKYNRVVQVGTQQRSGDHYQKAAEIIRGGQLGKITFVRTWNFGNQTPGGIGNPPDTNPPDGLDWDMWLGPARQKRKQARRDARPQLPRLRQVAAKSDLRHRDRASFHHHVFARKRGAAFGAPNCVERQNGKDRRRRRRVEVPVARISQAVEIDRVKKPGYASLPACSHGLKTHRRPAARSGPSARERKNYQSKRGVFWGV